MGFGYMLCVMDKLKQEQPLMQGIFVTRRHGYETLGYEAEALTLP